MKMDFARAVATAAYWAVQMDGATAVLLAATLAASTADLWAASKVAQWGASDATWAAERAAP